MKNEYVSFFSALILRSFDVEICLGMDASSSLLASSHAAELLEFERNDAATGSKSSLHFRLSHLPVEVLSIVNLYTSGISLLRLLLCGSKLLNFKLCKMRGATQFSIIHGLDHSLRMSAWHPQSWNVMLQFEGLRSIEFVGYDERAIRNLTTAHIAFLPSTIEIIRFGFWEALTMWIDLEGLELDKMEDGSSVASPKVYHLDSKFPNLKRLEIRSKAWDRFSIYVRPGLTVGFSWTLQMKQEFVAHLPSSLVHLNGLFSHVCIDFLVGLPADIQHLEVSMNGPWPPHQHDVFVNAALPKNLKSLNFQSTSGIRFNHFDQTLPHSLQSLSIGCLETRPPQACPIFFFPFTLTHLQLLTPLSWHMEDVLALPKALLHFEVRCAAPHFDGHLFDLLPPILHTILFGEDHLGRNPIPVQSMTTLSERPLQRLALNSSVPFAWSDIPALPPTLTYFSQPVMTFSAVPGRPQATRTEAFALWKSQHPLRCRFVTLNQDASQTENRPTSFVQSVTNQVTGWIGGLWK